MSHYIYLSEGITGKSKWEKPVTPITKSTIIKNNNIKKPKTKTKSWLGNLFSKQPAKTKPIVLNQQSHEQLYYEKYGIIYTGSDFGSCFNSLFS